MIYFEVVTILFLTFYFALAMISYAGCEGNGGDIGYLFYYNASVLCIAL